MPQLKRFFITPYIVYTAVATILGVIHLISGDYHPLPSAGVVLAAGAPLGFFIWLLLGRPARTSAHPLAFTLTSAAGVVLVMVHSQHSNQPAGAQFWLATLAFVGWYIYLRWYSRLPQAEPELLKVGQPLPDFALETPQGQIIDSRSFHGSPHVLLFYRGNWCPLCVAQVQEVVARWQELKQRGAEVVFVSPQPQQHTAQLAQRWNVPMQFLCDPNGKAAQQLGIAAPGGLPVGLEAMGYTADVVLPTIVIVDAQGVVRYAQVSDNYRVRPEPETLLRELDKIQARGAV